MILTSRILAFPCSDGYIDDTFMLNAAEARQAIIESVDPVSTERCLLANLYRRVAAADIPAPHDLPRFDHSSMDGYAIQSSDVRISSDSAARLTVQGQIQAGESAPLSLSPFHAFRVMTGAPLPQGADAVVEQELVAAQNGTISLTHPVSPGRNIRRRGEELKKGDRILKKGTRLRSAHVGLLASLGIVETEVYRRPAVAFLTTGNELIDPSESPKGGQIRNSNAFTLRGLIEETDCLPVSIGWVEDEQEKLREKLAHGLESDALVTSGGVSVGDFDFVLKALEALGVKIRFWKVNIKPGMPMAFGMTKEGVPVFALPGNPVSTMVTFFEFVRPALRRRGGEGEVEAVRLNAVLSEPIQKSDSKRHFVRGIMRNEGGRTSVVPAGLQSSGALSSLVRANCLIVIPEDARLVEAGQIVEIELL